MLPKQLTFNYLQVTSQTSDIYSNIVNYIHIRPQHRNSTYARTIRCPTGTISLLVVVHSRPNIMCKHQRLQIVWAQGCPQFGRSQTRVGEQPLCRSRRGRNTQVFQGQSIQCLSSSTLLKNCHAKLRCFPSSARTGVSVTELEAVLAEEIAEMAEPELRSAIGEELFELAITSSNLNLIMQAK